MAVNIIWSTINGGTAISDYVDHGDIANGAAGSQQRIFVRHDGSNVITNVKLYIREFSGSYNGDATASADFAEILSWGDESTASAFGGVLLNWNSATYSWPTYAAKAPTGSFVHLTGTGDSELNAVTLSTYSGASIAGQIISSSAPGVSFYMKVQVPHDEDTVGIRLFDHVMVYSYTS